MVAESTRYKVNYLYVKKVALDAGLTTLFDLSLDIMAIQYLAKHPTPEADRVIVDRLKTDLLPPIAEALAELNKAIEQKHAEFKFEELFACSLGETKEIIIDFALKSVKQSGLSDYPAYLPEIFESAFMKKATRSVEGSETSYDQISVFLEVLEPPVTKLMSARY